VPELDFIADEETTAVDLGFQPDADVMRPKREPLPQFEAGDIFEPPGPLPTVDWGKAIREMPGKMFESFIPPIPRLEGTTLADKLAAAPVNVAAGLVQGTLSPAGLASLPLSATRLGAPALRTLYSILAAKAAGTAAGEASVTADPQQIAEAALGAGLTAGIAVPGVLPSRARTIQQPGIPGRLLPIPRGAMPPPSEPAVSEVVTPEQEAMAARVMQRRATAAYEPPRAARAEVPGTPPEERQTASQVIRAADARTIKQVKAALGEPTMSNERAREFGRAAWGQWPPPGMEQAPPGPTPPPAPPTACAVLNIIQKSLPAGETLKSAASQPLSPEVLAALEEALKRKPGPPPAPPEAPPEAPPGGEPIPKPSPPPKGPVTTAEVLGRPPGEAAAPAPAPAAPEVAKLATGDKMNGLGDPIGTTYHATPADWVEWQDLTSKPLMAEGVWARREALKNKYGGMPPEAPAVPLDIGFTPDEPVAPSPAEPTTGKAPHPDIGLFSELVANTREFNQKRVSKARKTEIIERQKELRKKLLRKGYSADDIHGVEMGEREMPAAPTAGKGAPIVIQAYHFTTEPDFEAFNESKIGSSAGHTDPVRGFYLTTNKRYRGNIPEGMEDKFRRRDVTVTLKNPLRLKKYADVDQWGTDGDTARKNIEAAGFDGVIFAEGDEVIAFRPEQVKFKPTSPEPKAEPAKAGTGEERLPPDWQRELDDAIAYVRTKIEDRQALDEAIAQVRQEILSRQAPPKEGARPAVSTQPLSVNDFINAEPLQPRADKFSETTASKVAEEGFRPQESAKSPPLVWRDPATGKLYRAGGSSRAEGLRRLREGGQPVPDTVDVLFSDAKSKEDAFAEAIANNTVSVPENLVDTASAVRKARQQGIVDEEIAKLRRISSGDVGAFAAFDQFPEEIKSDFKPQGKRAGARPPQSEDTALSMGRALDRGIIGQERILGDYLSLRKQQGRINPIDLDRLLGLHEKYQAKLNAERAQGELPTLGKKEELPDLFGKSAAATQEDMGWQRFRDSYISKLRQQRTLLNNLSAQDKANRQLKAAGIRVTKAREKAVWANKQAASQLSAEMKQAEQELLGLAPKPAPAKFEPGDTLVLKGPGGTEEVNYRGPLPDDMAVVATKRGSQISVKMSQLSRPEQGPGMVGMGGAAAGELPPTGLPPGPRLTGTNVRSLEERGQLGLIRTPDPGEVHTPEEWSRIGQTLDAQPGYSENLLKELAGTTRPPSAAEFAALSAHSDRLEKAVYDAVRDHGPISPQAETALDANNDWAKRLKPQSSKWAELGRAQQGQRDIDTGDFVALQTEFFKQTGKDFTPQQTRTAHKIADENLDAGKKLETTTAKAKVAVDQLPGKAPDGTDVEATRKLFADYKPGSPMTSVQVKALWNYVKVHYLGKVDTDLGVTRQGVATDLGLTKEDVARGLAQTKTVKALSDDVAVARSEARRLKSEAKNWLKDQQFPGWQRFLRSIPDALFKLSVFGHGTTWIGTHTPTQVFNPMAWRTLFPAWGDSLKQMGLFLKDRQQAISFHENAMQDLRADPLYPLARRNGLLNDPHQQMDEYQKGQTGPLFRKFGLAGNMAWDWLKVARQGEFNRRWRAAPPQLQNVDYAKMLAESINAASGASTARFGQLEGPLRTTFFAPHLEVSRWKWLIKDTATSAKTLADWKNSTPEARRIALADVGQKASIAAVYYGLLQLNQAILASSDSKEKINFDDPRRLDFLAFKIHGYSVGIGTPMLGIVRLFANLLHAGFGQPRGIEEKLSSRTERVGKVAMRYARGKLSPFAQVGADVLTQEDVLGNTMPWSADVLPGYKRREGKHQLGYGEFAGEQFAPIPVSDAVREAFAAQGLTGDEADRYLRALLAGAAAGTAGIHLRPPPAEIR